MAKDGSFLSELTRRNVWRVGIAYVIGAWLFLQVLETVASITGAPEWIGKFLLVVVMIGMPVVLLLAWAYELTPEGIKRETDVAPKESITHETGARLNKITIGIFIIAVGWIIADRTILSKDMQPVAESQTVLQEEIVATEVVDKSIAVLPFTNMSEDASAGHFSDGLADTVLHKLAQLRSLHVVARNSSFQFRGQNIDVREVGEKLNVATVLEGSVQAAGSKIRVTAQLIDVSNGYHLWSGNFDRELTDVFGIQDEIAEEVVKALQVSLDAGDTAKLARRDTENVDAFREYSLALREIDEFSFESLPRAIAHLDKAIEIDPDYALAHATKGQAYRMMNNLGVFADKQFEEAATPPVERALELDPEMPLAIALSALLAYEHGTHDIALSRIEKAVALAPNNAPVSTIHAGILGRELQPHKAVEIMLRALELDPLSIPAHQGAAAFLRLLERYEEASALIDRMRVLKPGAPSTEWEASYLASKTGNWASAVMLMVEAHKLDPKDPITAMDIAWYLLALDLDDVAAEWMTKSRAINPEHPAAKASLLTAGAREDKVTEDTVRIARQLLIGEVPTANSARYLALFVIRRDAYRTGYFDEYLAWIGRYYPELMDPHIDNVDDSLEAAAVVGNVMVKAGLKEQGKNLQDLARRRQQAVRAAFGTAPDLDDFGIFARCDAREAALDVLESLPETLEIESLIVLRDLQHEPWIRDYVTEPAFQAMVANLEQHATEQRQLLFEMNGGAYPLPE